MNKRIRFYLGWALAGLAALLLLTRVILAPAATAAINGWFERQGLQSSIEDLSFELRQGRLVLSGLEVERDGSRRLRLRRLDLGWSWRDLFEGTARIEPARIEGLEVDVERDPGGRLVVAGIDLAAAGGESAQAQPAGEPPNWSLALPQFDIDGFQGCYRAPPQFDYCASFDRLHWAGSLELNLAEISDTALPLRVAGEFSLDKLDVVDNRLERSLLEFERLALEGIQVDTPERIELHSLVLDAPALLQRVAGDDRSQLTRFDSIRLQGIRLDGLARLEIDSVDLLGQETTLVNRADKGLDIEEWLPPGEPAPSGETATATTADTAAPGFSFALGQLHYRTDKWTHYSDQTLDKPFAADFQVTELDLTGLDTAQPGRPSQLHLRADNKDRATIELDGSVTPLAARPSFDLDGKISGLDLRNLSAFTAGAIGHDIKSGQLDAALKLKALQGQLDSELDLTLYHFKLVALSKADREKIDARMGFPLNASLSLLKDRDDTIALKIPVTGDLENPDFDPNDAISKAVSSAITSAVLNFYTPFGLVAVADSLFNLATALKFEPVSFPAGAADITEVDRGGLDKIAKLMRERPAVHVTLCGFSNSADRLRLLPDTADIPADELELDDAQRTLLADLGEKRAAAIKNYLVEQQIDPSRLVLCAPEHAEGEGLAGVEISI